MPGQSDLIFLGMEKKTHPNDTVFLLYSWLQGRDSELLDLQELPPSPREQDT